MVKNKPSGFQRLFEDGLNICISQINYATKVILQTLCSSHLIITVALMVGMIIVTPNTATPVTKSILKTGIPPKREETEHEQIAQ